MGVKKRFRDVDIWNKRWYRLLSPLEKTAWSYLTDRCDNVGVWEPDFEQAEFSIGSKVDWSLFLTHVNGNIETLDNGNWWFPRFCEFQYGELREDCIPHRSYIKLLVAHGLYERVSKGYPKGMARDKDKDKDIDTEEEKDPYGEFVTLTKREHKILSWQYGSIDLRSKIDDINNYCASSGKRYKNYSAVVRSWFKKDGVQPKAKTEDIRECENGHIWAERMKGQVCEECL